MAPCLLNPAGIAAMIFFAEKPEPKPRPGLNMEPVVPFQTAGKLDQFPMHRFYAYINTICNMRKGNLAFFIYEYLQDFSLPNSQIHRQATLSFINLKIY